MSDNEINMTLAKAMETRRAYCVLDYLNDPEASCALEDWLHKADWCVTTEAFGDSMTARIERAAGPEMHVVETVIKDSPSAARRRALALCAVKIFEGDNV